MYTMEYVFFHGCLCEAAPEPNHPLVVRCVPPEYGDGATGWRWFPRRVPRRQGVAQAYSKFFCPDLNTDVQWLRRQLYST